MLAIETTGLAKTFRKRRPLTSLLLRPWTGALQVRALDGVDLAIPFGTVFGVLGPNGAGKSTLIKIVASLIRPSAGEVRVNGFDPEVQGARVRASVGIVPSDERSLYWRISGRENLRFFARLHDLPRRRAEERIGTVLGLVEMEDRADDPVLSYSTGMRQRLTIARALLHDPPILFLDEPTRSLDPHAARRLRRFVRDRLHGEAGKTVFLATHNLAEAEELCDRVAVLRQGRIVAEGTMPEIEGRHRGRHRWRVTVAAPPGDALDGAGEEREDLGDGRFRITLQVGKGESLGERLRELLERGARILDCRRRDHPLQELFDRMSGEGEE